MRLFGKTALLVGLAGAMALGSMTASEARGGRNAAAIGAGVAGFAAGAAIGSAANSGYYYGNPGYAYDNGYDSYAYAPGYAPAAVLRPGRRLLRQLQHHTASTPTATARGVSGSSKAATTKLCIYAC